MKSVQFYHRATGIIHRNHFVTSDDSLVGLNTPADHDVIEVVSGVRFDHLTKKVDVARLQELDDAAATEWMAKRDERKLKHLMRVRMPGDKITEPFQDPAPPRAQATAEHLIDHRPPSPSAHHEWDESTKRWRLSAQESARQEGRRNAQSEIARLELQIQPRIERECRLNRPGAIERMEALDAQLAVQRAKL